MDVSDVVAVRHVSEEDENGGLLIEVRYENLDFDAAILAELIVVRGDVSNESRVELEALAGHFEQLLDFGPVDLERGRLEGRFEKLA